MLYTLIYELLSEDIFTFRIAPDIPSASQRRVEAACIATDGDSRGCYHFLSAQLNAAERRSFIFFLFHCFAYVSKPDAATQAAVGIFFYLIYTFLPFTI